MYTVNVHVIFLCSIIVLNVTLLTCDFVPKPFDDSTLFKINWPGKDDMSFLDDFSTSEVMSIVSSNNEKYQCYLPNVQATNKDSEVEYTGPGPFEFIEPLFSQKPCSYRLESYWTYEVCHGRYVRQFHEDRESKKEVKLQEYFLGRWDKTQESVITAKLKETTDVMGFKKIDGLKLPYLEVNMTDGTICDLNGEPRETRILYMCHTVGRHDIYSLKETSTCKYEVIIFTSLLCKHPKFKAPETGEHNIFCRPDSLNTPTKPLNLEKIEAESLKMRHQNLLSLDSSGDKLQKVLAIFKLDPVEGQEGETRIQLELRSIDAPPLNTAIFSPNPLSEPPGTIASFLSGDHCFHGGTGWWKYEFCYQKKVDQYHMHEDRSKTIVRLGVFNLDKHKQWLKDNPHKQPKPLEDRTFVSHFYSGGAICESSGNPREVEVKLKCVNSGIGSVALYLLEPSTCHYILGVESSLFCKLLPYADEFGIFQNVPPNL